MKDAIELIKALSLLLWPIILAILLWKLFPALKAIVSSRAFSVKIAGMEVSVQDATEQLRVQIGDLQKQVIALRSGTISDAAPAAMIAPATPALAPAPRRVRSRAVLWVDDKPSNNAFEIAQLKSRGIDVVPALSTADALACIAGRDFGAVVSDMGRREDGQYRGDAGMQLLRGLREQDPDMPFMIYTSAARAGSTHAAVSNAGGDGATASPVELLEWIAGKTSGDQR